MTSEIIYFKRINALSSIPFKKNNFDAGYDLRSIDNIVIPSKGRALVRTGLVFILSSSDNIYLRIASRSGLSLNFALEVGAGVIDSNYRGEVKVLLYNHGERDFEVSIGDRICQVIPTRISYPTLTEVESFENTSSRGIEGWGSSGLQ